MIYYSCWGQCCSSVLNYRYLFAWCFWTVYRFVYIVWWILYIPVHIQLSSAVGRSEGAPRGCSVGEVEACVLNQPSWKFDFSEAYNNCQCFLQFRSFCDDRKHRGVENYEQHTAWFNFCHLFRKKVTLRTLEVVRAFRSCVTDKAAACVRTPPLLISFVSEIDLSVAYFISFTYAFLDLFVDLFGYCE